MGNACCGSQGAVVVGYRQFDSKTNHGGLHEEQSVVSVDTYRHQDQVGDRAPLLDTKKTESGESDTENVTSLYTTIQQRSKLSKRESFTAIPANPRHRPKTPAFGRENTGFSLNYELPDGYAIDNSRIMSPEPTYNTQSSPSSYTCGDAKSSGYSSSMSIHNTPSGPSSNFDRRNSLEDDKEIAEPSRRGLKRQNSLSYRLPSGYNMPVVADISTTIISGAADGDYEVDRGRDETRNRDYDNDPYTHNYTSSAKILVNKTVDIGDENERNSTTLRIGKTRENKSVGNHRVDSPDLDEGEEYSSEGSSHDDLEPRENVIEKPRQVETLARYFESMKDDDSTSNENTVNRNKNDIEFESESDRNSIGDNRSESSHKDNVPVTNSNKELVIDTQRQQAEIDEINDCATSEGELETEHKLQTKLSVNIAVGEQDHDLSHEDENSNRESQSNRTRKSPTPMNDGHLGTGSAENMVSDQEVVGVSSDASVMAEPRVSSASTSTGGVTGSSETDLLEKIQDLKSQLAELLSEKNSKDLIIHPITVILHQFVQLKMDSHGQNKGTQVIEESDITEDEHWTELSQIQQQEEMGADEKYARLLSDKKDKLSDEEVNEILKAHMENRNRLTKRQATERDRLRQQIRAKLQQRKLNEDGARNVETIQNNLGDSQVNVPEDETAPNENNRDGSNNEKTEIKKREADVSNDGDMSNDDKSTNDNDRNENYDYEDDFDDEANETVDDQYKKVLETASDVSNDDYAKSESDVELPVFEDDENEKELLDILHQSLMKKKDKLSRDDFKDLLALYRDQQNVQRNQQEIDELKQSESLKDKLEARRRKRLEAKAAAERSRNDDDENIPGSIEVQTDGQTIYVTDAEVQTVMSDVLDDDAKTRSVQIMDRGFLRKLKGKHDLSDDEVQQLLTHHLSAVAKLEEKKEEQRLKQLGIIAEKLDLKRRARDEKTPESEDVEQEKDQDAELNVIQKDIIANRHDMSEDELKEILEKHHQQRRALIRKKQFDQLKNKEEIQKKLKERREKKKEEDKDKDVDTTQELDEYSDKSVTEIALEKELAELDTRFFKDLKKKKKNKELTDDLLQDLVKEHNDNAEWIRHQRKNENTDSARKLRQKLKERKERAQQQKHDEENEEDGKKIRERHHQIKTEEETMRRFSLQRADSVIVRTKKKEDELKMMVNDDKQRRKEDLKARLEARRKNKKGAGEGK